MTETNSAFQTIQEETKNTTVSDSDIYSNSQINSNLDLKSQSDSILNTGSDLNLNTESNSKNVSTEKSNFTVMSLPKPKPPSIPWLENPDFLPSSGSNSDSDKIEKSPVSIQDSPNFVQPIPVRSSSTQVHPTCSMSPILESIVRPASPRDTTPITVNGKILDRTEIDSIKTPDRSSYENSEKITPVISQKVLTDVKQQSPYISPSLVKASPRPTTSESRSGEPATERPTSPPRSAPRAIAPKPPTSSTSSTTRTTQTTLPARATPPTPPPPKPPSTRYDSSKAQANRTEIKVKSTDEERLMEQRYRELNEQLQRRELEIQKKEEEIQRLNESRSQETSLLHEERNINSDTLELDGSDDDLSTVSESSSSSNSSTESNSESNDESDESSEELFEPRPNHYARRNRQNVGVNQEKKKIVYVRKKGPVPTGKVKSKTNDNTAEFVKIPDTTPVMTTVNKRIPPNFKTMTEIQKMEYRAYYKIQFVNLRQQYPKYEYPTFEDTVELEIIDTVYHKYLEHITREKNIYSSVSKYKIYFAVLLLILQIFGQKTLGFNLDGFAESQLKNMTEYDPLFIELGVKYQNPGSNSTPIEIRIMLVLLFNAVVFILINVISSFLNPQLGKQIYSLIINTLHSNTPAPVQAQSSPTHPGVQSIPPPQAPSSLDIPNLLTSLAGMFGGGGGETQSVPSRAPRRPKYTE